MCVKKFGKKAYFSIFGFLFFQKKCKPVFSLRGRNVCGRNGGQKKAKPPVTCDSRGSAKTFLFEIFAPP